jgi:hypothetical protein
VDFGYSVEKKDVEKLKLLLSQDSLEKNSFATLGYWLKDSESLGLPAGKIVLCFKAEGEVGKSLFEKLKPLESLVALKEDEMKKAFAKIEEDENAAAGGFGAIFS